MALYSRNLSSPQAKEGGKGGKEANSIILGIKLADNHVSDNTES